MTFLYYLKIVDMCNEYDKHVTAKNFLTVSETVKRDHTQTRDL